MAQGEKAMNTPEYEKLRDDVTDLEESLYELHLRMRGMTASYLWHGSDTAERMAGLIISELDLKLVELYRQAATLVKHLR